MVSGINVAVLHGCYWGGRLGRERANNLEGYLPERTICFAGKKRIRDSLFWQVYSPPQLKFVVCIVA